jgi:hypothetical protein
MSTEYHRMWTRWRSTPLILFLLLPIVAKGAETPPNAAELERYVGIYTAPPFHRLTVTVAGNVLKGDPGNGRPAGTLLPLRERGRFQLKEADFEIQFLEDRSGTVYGLEMTGRGVKQQMRRTNSDTTETRSSIRALAVNAEASVNAKVYNEYKRNKDGAGKFQPETYVAGRGGFQNSGVGDASAENVSFEEIVRTLAPALAKQQYLPAPTEEEADLLLMVYWGATASDDHPAVRAEEMWDPLSHSFRRQLNRLNARLLGFTDAVKGVPIDGSIDGPATRMSAVRDVMEDMQASRYWVAVVALDFQELLQTKNTKVLWSVRYNVRSRGTNFPEALPGMTELAALYFGRDSGGLVNPAINRNQTKGRVEIGDLKVITEEPAPTPTTEK